MKSESAKAISWRMSRVKSSDTKPEKIVRSALHCAGYRFRLHKKDLPGKPDVVLAKYKTVIFVNGCFWHRHKNCSRATTPTSNQDFWLAKFQYNVDRDKKEHSALRRAGWKVIVIWECMLGKKSANTFKRLFATLDGRLTELRQRELQRN